MVVSTPSHHFALVFTGFLTVAVCGCGSRTGTVEGKATVDGKPAAGATVVFSGGENQSAMAIVQEDGTYQTAGVPVGAVRVALMPNMVVRGASELPVRRGVKRDKENLPTPVPVQHISPSPAIPKRYTNVATSGLTLTVKGGGNEFNIEMTSR
jgi:hypothetical protein